MKKRIWKGLRAIDLAIIFSIICMVLAIVIIRFPDFKCRAMASEAKFSLAEIYAAQIRYHAQHGHYAQLEKLLNAEKRLSLPQKYYTFEDIRMPTRDNFSIAAQGASGTMVAGDLWIVNESKDIEQRRAVCKN